MPSLEAWEAFAGVGGVIIFLGSVVFGLQRLGFIGQKKPVPAPAPAVPPAPAEPPGPSPEALALIEATTQLVKAVEAIAIRSESSGRIHGRLDDLNGDVGRVGSGLAELRGEVIAMSRNVNLIHDHLLNQK